MKQQPVIWAVMKSVRLIIVLIDGHTEIEDITENEGWMTVWRVQTAREILPIE
jgi:hypothetical protein